MKFHFFVFFRKESGNSDNDGTPAESTQKTPMGKFPAFSRGKGKNIWWSKKCQLEIRPLGQVSCFCCWIPPSDELFIHLMEDELRVATTPLKLVFQTGGKVIMNPPLLKHNRWIYRFLWKPRRTLVAVAKRHWKWWFGKSTVIRFKYGVIQWYSTSWNPNDPYFQRSTPQNKALTRTKRRVIKGFQDAKFLGCICLLRVLWELNPCQSLSWDVFLWTFQRLKIGENKSCPKIRASRRWWQKG